MKCAVITLAMGTLGVALIGAWYWWRSSRVITVPTWGDIEPGDELLSQMGWIAGSLEAARQSLTQQGGGDLDGLRCDLGSHHDRCRSGCFKLGAPLPSINILCPSVVEFMQTTLKEMRDDAQHNNDLRPFAPDARQIHSA
jgi:hypothetical protein